MYSDRHIAENSAGTGQSDAVCAVIGRQERQLVRVRFGDLAGYLNTALAAGVVARAGQCEGR